MGKFRKTKISRCEKSVNKLPSSSHGPLLCYTHQSFSQLSNPRIEDFIDKTWKEYCTNSIVQVSVIFPQRQPKTNNILIGETFKKSTTQIHVKNFTRVNPFLWVAQQQDQGYAYKSTIVVDWGAISNKMCEIVKSMKIVPNALADIIILYASPLSAFVQECPPKANNKWNNQNNKWFLGEWSNTNTHDSCKNSMSKKLSNISNDKDRLQKLFAFLENQDKMILLLNECLGDGYFDFINPQDTQRNWIATIEGLQSKYERFRLFTLAIAQRTLTTKNWFHENFPLDYF